MLNVVYTPRRARYPCQCAGRCTRAGVADPCELDSVGVKVTSPEGLGAAGAGAGIVAQAVVLIEPIE